MGQEINLLDRYPRSKRPIEERGAQITEEHRAIARQFGREFFDGDRLTGYGGYHYDPRFWTETVERFIEHYDVPENASILDVGCAKGFMLADFRRAIPHANLCGFDVSRYAIESAHPDIAGCVYVGNATKLPNDQLFDLAISINTIHNLPLEGCKQALQEIERVAINAFITVDAWRTEEERDRLFKWNLTALTMMHVDDWKQLFEDVGYTGDYYWFIAE